MAMVHKKMLFYNIEKNLYDVETSIESAKEDFEKYGIDVERFLRIIALYISSFELLKESKEEQLLTLLDEKLKIILASYERLKLYHVKIKSSILFIEKHKDTFFIKIVTRNPKEEMNTPIFLDSIKIKKYFSIVDMEIQNLKDKREIYFVGENGDGKTILLQAILLALKKEYSGMVIEHIRNSGMDLSAKDEFDTKYRNDFNIKNVFAYGINRNKTADSNARFDKYGYGGLFDTNDYRDTTLLKDPFFALGKNYKGDKELLKAFIKELNKTILMEDLNIFNDGDIDFNELSEGYKSTIIWLYDLVSRLIENQPEVKELAELKAIVLIDEVDLYLHPKWKYDFVHSLREVFENIQFIMVTHSIVTVLGASDDAVFYKVYKENGDTKISQAVTDISDYSANILSTSPIFDMKSAKSRAYNEKENQLSSDDYKAHQLNESIDKMLSSDDDDEIKEDILAQLRAYNEGV
jgi:predicted ATP-binding protein involved in virulence